MRLPALSLFTRLAVVLATALVFPGCSWFRWLGFDDDEDRARPVTTMQAPDHAPPAGETLADRRLRRVYDNQQELYAQLNREGDALDGPEYDRLVQEVLTEYQSYLADYPESAHGFILYGKMLRDAGERESANFAFLRANQLDGNIAVVKQQIGNYLAEEGDAAHALAYYLAAAELAPTEAVYAYQIGELLHTYHDELVDEGAVDAALIDRQMLDAFAQASRLAPGDRRLRQRHAEAYFDVSAPDWPAALTLWQALAASAQDPLQRQWALLQQARVLIALGRGDEARDALAQVTRPGLQDAKEALLGQVGQG